MKKQLLVVVLPFFYVAILQSGVFITEARCQEGICNICFLGLCLKCNDGYFAKSGGCGACTGSDARHCSACKTGYYRSRNTNTCSQCNTRCTMCYGSAYTQCSACANGYYLSGNTCNPCHTRCTACTGHNYQQCFSCAAGYYLTGNTCNPCHTRCAACTGHDYQQCFSCAAGYYLTGNTCNRCHTRCTACTGHDYQQCSSCAAGYYLSGNTCNPCGNSCTKCSLAAQCTECVRGRYGRVCTGTCTECKNDVCDIYGKCIQGCKDGTNGTYCKNDACNESCVSCSSSRACDICAQGTYRTLSHQLGYHCISCPDSCAACTSATSCQSCSSTNFNTDMYTKCECDASKCAAVSNNLCSACNDMNWYPIQSGCCPCRQTCEAQQCGSGGVCNQGCIDGYYGDICQHVCEESCPSQICHRHNGTCIDVSGTESLDVSGTESQNTGDGSQTSSVMGPAAAVGSAVGALVVVCVIVGFVIIFLCKKGYCFKQSNTPRLADDSTRDESNKGQHETYDDCSTYEGLQVYGLDTPRLADDSTRDESNKGQHETYDDCSTYEQLQLYGETTTTC